MSSKVSVTFDINDPERLKITQELEKKAIREPLGGALMGSQLEYNIEHAFSIIADNFDKLGDDVQVVVSGMCLLILNLAINNKCKDDMAIGAINVLGQNLRRIEELGYNNRKLINRNNNYIELLVILMSDDYSGIQEHAIGMIEAHYPTLSKAWQKRIKLQFNSVENDSFGLAKVKQDLRKTINAVEESNEDRNK